MGTPETWTIGSLLTWTTEYLKKQGAKSPRLDAEVLLAHSRDCQRIELYTAFDQQPDDEVKSKFRELVRQRASGTPVAYLVGYKEFYSLNFDVNPSVLIPRPETEHLILASLDAAKSLRPVGPLRIVDVGTGSGNIAVCLAKHLPQARVLALELDPAALEVARLNAEKHSLPVDRLDFCQSDLFDNVESESRFDLIVSNPPYVSAAEFAQLDRSVREFEPELALVADDDGAAVIRRLIEQAKERLTSDGRLLLELSPMLAPRVGEWLNGAWQTPEIIKDLAGCERVVILTKRSA